MYVHTYLCMYIGMHFVLKKCTSTHVLKFLYKILILTDKHRHYKIKYRRYQFSHYYWKSFSNGNNATNNFKEIVVGSMECYKTYTITIFTFNFCIYLCFLKDNRANKSISAIISISILLIKSSSHVIFNKILVWLGR